MAKTSYGYVERNLENDVNWAEVGKGFSDMLIAERDERKEKKQYLEDVFAETQANFEKNAPIGYNTTFNDLTMDVASNSTSFAVAAKRDLQRGLISPQEFLKKMQRLNASADVFFELGNNFNSIYEKKLDRMDKNESGGVEQVSFEAMADLTNFNNHGVTVDKNGNIVAAPLVKDKNGVVSMDVNNARSVQAVFNLAQNEVNRLDLDGEVQKKVKILGETILGKDIAATQSKEGLKTVLKGLKVTDPERYNEWKQSVVKGIMASDLDIASVLHDYNKIYELTTDPEVYKKNKDKYIYVDLTDGKEVKVELTQEQRDKAVEIIEGVVDSQSKSSQEETATSKIPPNVALLRYVSDINKENIAPQKAATMLGYLYAGKSQADIDIAADYFMGINPKIKQIIRGPEKIEISFENEDGKIEKTDLGYGSDFNMFIKGASLLTGDKNVSNAINKIDKANLKYVDGKYVFNKDVTSTRTRSVDKDNSYGDFINAKIIPNKKGSVNEALSITLGTGFQVSEDGESVKILDKRAAEEEDNVGKEYRYDSDSDMRELRNVLRGMSSGESAFKVTQKNMGSDGESKSAELD